MWKMVSSPLTALHPERKEEGLNIQISVCLTTNKHDSLKLLKTEDVEYVQSPDACVTVTWTSGRHDQT